MCHRLDESTATQRGGGGTGVAGGGTSAVGHIPSVTLLCAAASALGHPGNGRRQEINMHTRVTDPVKFIV